VRKILDFFKDILSSVFESFKNFKFKKIVFIGINVLIVLILVIGIKRLLAPPAQVSLPKKTKVKKSIPKGGKEKKPISKEELPLPFMPKKEENIPVKVYKLSPIRFTDELPVVGTVKSIPKIELKFEINGVIKSFRFKEGDQIKRGDVIVTLNSEDLRKEVEWSKAKLRVAKAELKSAQTRYNVLKNLYDAGAITKDRLDQAQADVDVAKARIIVSQREMEISLAKLKKVKLIAPRDSIFGKREKQPGEFVTPNDVVATLFDPENMFVEVGIIEKDVWRIKPNQKAKIYVDTYPNRPFFGYVEDIFPQIEERTRTMTVRLRVLDPGKLLKPGMFARVEITIYKKSNALVVPTTSVIVEKGRYYVATVEDNKIQYKPIRDEYRTLDYVVIRSGVNAGDLVITETPGMKKLPQGTGVKIIETKEKLFE
jgi:membrane fusion protein (multidrug efflux system)